MRTLREYWNRQADVRAPLEAWYDFIHHARWNSPADVKRDFRSASILGDNRVVFNIKGNQYRLVVRLNYPMQTVYVRFIGTHTEYDRIDATRV